MQIRKLNFIAGKVIFPSANWWPFTKFLKELRFATKKEEPIKPLKIKTDLPYFIIIVVAVVVYLFWGRRNRGDWQRRVF